MPDGAADPAAAPVSVARWAGIVDGGIVDGGIVDLVVAVSVGDVVVAERLGHEEAASPLGLRVAVDEDLEGGGVVGHHQVGELVHQHVVEDPRWPARQPGGDADVAGGGGARPPARALLGPRHRCRSGKRVALGEQGGPGLEIDRRRLIAPLEPVDEGFDVAFQLAGVDAGGGLDADHPVDDGGLDGLASTSAVDDLDGEGGAVGDGHDL